jgi:UDP-glucose 4-epimerase
MSPTQKRILVTGGCGYIGSHTLVSLLDPSNTVHYSVVVVDNLANSSAESLRRVADISSLKHFCISSDGESASDQENRLVFRKVNCCNERALRAVFAEFQTLGGFDAVVHFAGLKAVGESKLIPLSYYSDNLGSTLTLLSLMEEFGCRSIVFSSSATVYGIARDESVKLKESDEVGVTITNCYGRTKYMIEQILSDFHSSHKYLREAGTSEARDWSITILRYFNPVGAHPSGKMGEDPHGVPNNLMPFVAQVAVGRRPHVSIFGNDYNTPDGTGVRDYLHVMDLADGHVAALRYMDSDTNNAGGVGRLNIFNLGTGTGYSVLDMVRAMGKACGKEIPYVLAPRRPGDVTIYMADPTKAKEDMGWEAKRNLDDMCNDLWNWQTNNPNGYGSSD